MRGGVRLFICLVALLGASADAAAAASPGSTDELRLTTTRPAASTGVVSSEVFNARYPDGNLKPLRHSLISFPRGTTFDAKAIDLCTATDADFMARGMSACPASSRMGSGRATVVTTGISGSIGPVGPGSVGPLGPVEAGPISVDVTAFARPDGSVMVFSSHGIYTSNEYIRAHGHSQTTDTKPACIVVVESPNCRHGEIAPRSLTLTVPPRSRVVDGRRHNLVTTPRRCPASRHWRFSDVHTFADGSRDVFVNHPRCVRRAHRGMHPN